MWNPSRIKVPACMSSPFPHHGLHKKIRYTPAQDTPRLGPVQSGPAQVGVLILTDANSAVGAIG